MKLFLKLSNVIGISSSRLHYCQYSWLLIYGWWHNERSKFNATRLIRWRLMKCVETMTVVYHHVTSCNAVHLRRLRNSLIPLARMLNLTSVQKPASPSSYGSNYHNLLSKRIMFAGLYLNILLTIYIVGLYICNLL